MSNALEKPGRQRITIHRAYVRVRNIVIGERVGESGWRKGAKENWGRKKKKKSRGGRGERVKKFANGGRSVWKEVTFKWGGKNKGRGE